MFVHINPEANAIGETISTLKFAERVASIELGAARANKETTEIRDLKAEVFFFLLCGLCLVAFLSLKHWFIEQISLLPCCRSQT